MAGLFSEDAGRQQSRHQNFFQKKKKITENGIVISLTPGFSPVNRGRTKPLKRLNLGFAANHRAEARC
jgi:hypothetical protein